MNISEELVARYLSGNSCEEECEELLRWVEASEKNKEIFASIKNTWVLSNIKSDSTREESTARSYQAVVSKINNNSEAVPTRRIQASMFKTIAASVIVTIGLTALISYFIWSKPETKLAYHQLVVPSGQQAQLTLSDGTKIWLNSKSKLTYPGTFEAKSREVILDGEGYFQVSHNAQKPFIVKTSHLDVKVLGTSFNVTSYSDEDDISLALETGSISITEKGSEKTTIKLKPDDLAVYSKISKNITLSKADTEVYKSWLKGQFKFHNLSFEDISKRLGRNFNVEFIFENKNVKHIKYNGSFYNYESLGQILKVMQTNSVFRYKIIKDKVFIQ